VVEPELLNLLCRGFDSHIAHQGCTMSNLKDYFEKQERYKPKWENGVRVFGHWNKIPFVGSVVADREEDHILIHSDLPIKFDNKLNNIIVVKHKDISQLKEF
jgi:hypothetical protein